MGEPAVEVKQEAEVTQEPAVVAKKVKLEAESDDAPDAKKIKIDPEAPEALKVKSEPTETSNGATVKSENGAQSANGQDTQTAEERGDPNFKRLLVRQIEVRSFALCPILDVFN